MNKRILFYLLIGIEVIGSSYTKENFSHVCLLPFNFNSMPFYYKSPFPKVNVENDFAENFVPLKHKPKDLGIQDQKYNQFITTKKQNYDMSNM